MMWADKNIIDFSREKKAFVQVRQITSGVIVIILQWTNYGHKTLQFNVGDERCCLHTAAVNKITATL